MAPARTLASLAAVTLALTACGQATRAAAPAPPKGLSPAALVQVAQTTGRASTERMSMTITQAPQSAATHLILSTSGTLTTGLPFRDSMSVTSIGADGKAIHMQERMFGTTLYMRSPAFDSFAPPSRPWVKVDATTLPNGSALKAELQAGNDTSKQSLALLHGALGAIRKVGTEPIRGVATTHFKTTVSFDKALQAMSPQLRAALTPSINQLKALTGSDTMPLELWIDAQHHLRAEQYSLTSPQFNGSLIYRIELYDFGAPLNVTVPPASEVSHLPAAASNNV
jgi:hypothetical protein